MSKARRKKLEMLRKTEFVTLRALRSKEEDYADEVENEAWCRLHEDLPDKYRLRFLVRSITDNVVTVGGIDVRNRLVVVNGAKPRELDEKISSDTLKEMHFSWAWTMEDKPDKILVIDRCSKGRTYEFRAKIQLRLMNSFEFQFPYWGRYWCGNVQLLAIEQEPRCGDEPAHLTARFEIVFAEIEAEDYEDDETEDDRHEEE